MTGSSGSNQQTGVEVERECDSGAPDTWIVIPAFNEGSVIGDTVRAVVTRYPRIVVVDDGSSDDTWLLAQEAGAAVLRHPINLGQGAALQTGIVYALKCGAELIVTFDGDGQHQVEDVDDMIDTLLRTGSDVALGSRFLGSTVGLPWKRRIMLKGAVIFTWLTTGLKLTDAHNGLRVLTRRAAQMLEIRQNGMAHASEIIRNIAHLRLRYVEVPMTIIYTEYSLSKGQKISNLFNILGELFSGRMQR